MNKIKTVGFTLLASAMVMGVTGCKKKAEAEHPEHPTKEAAAKEHPAKDDAAKAKPLDHPAH